MEQLAIQNQEESGGVLSQQISIMQAREAIRITRGLIPVLNQDELAEVMAAFQKIIERLLEESKEEVVE